MTKGIGTEIHVRRRERDGWHVYTCNELPGLFLASKDDNKAYGDLPEAIRLLFKLDFGRDVTVAHKIGYSQFLDQIALSRRAAAAVQQRTNDLIDGHDSDISFLVGSAQEEDRVG